MTPSEGNLLNGFKRPCAETRLESWKEIAAHLKRTVRTARRWERLEDLPVHRHNHDRRATVYASQEELDACLATRSRGHQEDGSATKPAGRPWARWVLYFTLGSGLVLAGFLLYGVVFRNWVFVIRL